MFTTAANRYRLYWPLELKISWGENLPIERVLIVLAMIRAQNTTVKRGLLANFQCVFSTRPLKSPLPKVCMHMFCIGIWSFWVCAFALCRCDSTKLKSNAYDTYEFLRQSQRYIHFLFARHGVPGLAQCCSEVLGWKPSRLLIVRRKSHCMVGRVISIHNVD